MTVQLALIQDTDIKKTIITVPISSLSLSEFNPRHTRPDEDIDKLAARISRNGFEVTRALWAYQNGSGYKVFAGGTRLEAAKRAALPEVPIMLHEGLTDEDIVKLAEIDNENDEYHATVNDVDKWAHCTYLKDDKGWGVDKISQAKGKGERHIYNWLALNKLPGEVKYFCNQKLLDEAHLIEILGIAIDCKFTEWLTTEQAQLELTQKAVQDKSKNGSKTVKAVKADVELWKEFINYADDVYRNFQPTTLYDFSGPEPVPFSYDSPAEFVQELARRQARSLVEVKAAERTIRLLIADTLAQYEKYIQNVSTEAAQKALLARQEDEILTRFKLGDCLELAATVQKKSVKLLLLDPPYGQNYQSNRRWKSNPPSKLINDNPVQALDLLRSILDSYLPTLADDAHVLIFCGWRNEPEIRAIVNEFLTIRGSLVWVKDEHSAGDLDSSFGPSHERIIHATMGKPTVRPRLRDVFEYHRDLQWPHPTVKPLPLLTDLINACTLDGDLIIDPTAGIASSLIAAHRTNRQFWGCEIDDNYHQIGCSRLLEELKNGKIK